MCPTTGACSGVGQRKRGDEDCWSVDRDWEKAAQIPGLSGGAYRHVIYMQEGARAGVVDPDIYGGTLSRYLVIPHQFHATCRIIGSFDCPQHHQIA